MFKRSFILFNIFVICFAISERPKRWNSFPDVFSGGFPTFNNGNPLFAEDFGMKLEKQIHDKIEEQLQPLNHQLLNLQNLGFNIQQQVEKNLLPVKAMQIRLNMMNGIGGVTVIRFFPSGKTLIAKDGYRQECNGVVNEDGICSGPLTPLDTQTNQENYCYTEPNVKVNNYYCLSSGINKGISVTSVNGKVTCTTTDNSPVLLITSDEYKKMCDKVAASVQYTYIADSNNPLAVKIPVENPYFKCNVIKPGVCAFS